jgi:hypothetical protein
MHHVVQTTSSFSAYEADRLDRSRIDAVFLLFSLLLRAKIAVQRSQRCGSGARPLAWKRNIPVKRFVDGLLVGCGWVGDELGFEIGMRQWEEYL